MRRRDGNGGDELEFASSFGARAVMIDSLQLDSVLRARRFVSMSWRVVVGEVDSSDVRLIRNAVVVWCGALI